jgi:predicted permease
MLLREPLFSIVVIVTLALGMTSTSAMFHAVDRALLHPVPYPDPDRIVYLGWIWMRGSGAGALSARKFAFWHDESRVFDGLATSRTFEAQLGADADGPFVRGMSITADYFRAIGVTPEYGRAFSADEYKVGAPPVVILGNDLWRAQFGGDQRVMGREIRLGGKPYVVVGVMPPTFEVAEASEWTQVVTPLSLTPAQLADGGNNYIVIGRLRPSVTVPQATADMTRVFAAFGAAFPGAVEKFDGGVKLYSYRSLIVGDDLSKLLWLMLGATGLVFLLACANIGNLLLARALSRQREFAVRTALGAGRGRLVQQVVIETLVLGAASAGLATIASLFSVRAVVALAHGALLRESQLRLDARVVLFTALIGLAASLTIGPAVSLFGTRIDLARGLAEGGRSMSGGRTRRVLRGTLLTSESAIAMTLLAAAGLLITSYGRLLAVDPGFDRSGIFTASITHAPLGYDSTAAVWQFEQRALTRLRATPGIARAAATATLPLKRGWNLPATVDGPPDQTDGGTEWRAVSPGYFPALGIRMIAGRDFTDADDGGAPGVVVVSESLARAYWPGKSAIGRRVFVGRVQNKPVSPAFDEPARVIVGVVSDLKDMQLDQTQVRHTLWVPQAQVVAGFTSLPAFVVRANDAGVAATALRRAIAGADPRMRTVDVAAMSDIVSQSLLWRRFQTTLISLFAGLALVLTAVGIYGVVAYSVANRVHEIGVRMALGARPSRVVRLIVSQGMRSVLVGLVIGLAGAISLSRVIAGMVYGISPRDPRALTVVSVVLCVVALVASYVPARRATRIDPLTALRSE